MRGCLVCNAEMFYHKSRSGVYKVIFLIVDKSVGFLSLTCNTA